MQDDGLHFGPRLYDEDEESSGDDRPDSESSAERMNFGMEGGDVAPHERLRNEEAQKAQNSLQQARLNALGDELASTLRQLQEAAGVAQSMDRALKNSRKKTVEQLVQFEGNYKGVDNMAQHYLDMFDCGVADCTQKVSTISKQVNDMDRQLNTADSLVDTLETVRAITLAMTTSMEPLAQ
ncbi:unnamed protein product, partial [Mesorhabditis spiculigera]